MVSLLLFCLLLCWGQSYPSTTATFSGFRPIPNPAGSTGAFSLPSLLGDLDGDGVSELVFGEADLVSSTDQGAIHVLFSKNGESIFQSFAQSALPLKGVPLQTGNLFGLSVCSVGDLDRDGYPEIAVSCPYCDPGVILGTGSSGSSGVVFILFMAPSSTSSILFNPEKTRVLSGLALNAGTIAFGYRVSPAGDVNGDGVDDLLVSEKRTSDGRFWLVLLTSNGGVLTANRFSNTDNSWGLSPRTIGDLDQDGVLDIVAWSNFEVHLMFMQSDGKLARTVQILNTSSRSLDGNLSLPALADVQGPVIQAVESFGDVNGDGIIDLLLATQRTATSLYAVCLALNGTALTSPTALTVGRSWPVGGISFLGDWENTNVAQLIGVDGISYGLMVASFDPPRKDSQALCYSNAECAGGVCGVLSEHSSGELPPAAGRCVTGWTTFSGLGYALAAGPLGSEFTIDAFLRHSQVAEIGNTRCRNPVLSRQNPSGGYLEFSLCILANNQIEFRLSSLAGTELVLRANLPAYRLTHVKVVGDGELKLLSLQERVVRVQPFSGTWNGEGYALNMGQMNGNFLYADVVWLWMNGQDLIAKRLDPCTNNMCTFPGSCKVLEGLPACVCPPGTSGDGVRCTNVNACLNNSCAFNVTCYDDVPFSDGYSCDPCPPGTVGDAKYACEPAPSCTQEVSPCFHPETCVQFNDTVNCSCIDGEYGDGLVNGTSCTDINSCDPSPCPDGFPCVDFKAPRTGYSCPGVCFNGTTWSAQAQACVDFDACSLRPCFPGANCTDLPPPSPDALCGPCPPGMVGTAYGLTGCTDVNECLPTNPCFQGNCVSLSAAEATRLHALGFPGYYCRPCPVGYDGDGIVCVDKDYCSPSNLCFDPNTCVDRPAPQIGYDCGPCPVGTTGSYGRNCVDIDACALYPAPCYPGVNCTDNPAPSLGATCGPCPAGFEGNGSICTDINECLKSPCYHNSTYNVSVECINLRGSFTCGQCPIGFLGDGVTCVPYSNPCLVARCDGCVAVGIRSFRCPPCGRGNVSTPNGCLVFDPCSEEPCSSVGNFSRNCTKFTDNQTYTCGACPSGYAQSNLSTNLCTNFDACNASSCFPGSECYDLPPPSTGFDCGPCPVGYIGNASNFTCRDYDACTANPCYPNVTCVDLPPPSVTAQCGACPAGRVGNGFQCADYDACVAQPIDCFPGADCVDNPPPSMGYKCGACPLNYAGDGKTCVFIDVCKSLPCRGNATCRPHMEPMLSRSCTFCPMGFVENVNGTCVDFDACGEHPCGARQCNDLPPPSMGFYCTDCPFGTVVDTAGTNCTDPDRCVPVNPCASPLLCVDLAGATGYLCVPSTLHPTPSRQITTQEGIKGDIHFPSLAWEAWVSKSVAMDESFRTWMQPALSLAAQNTSTYNASTATMQLNATNAGSDLTGVLVQFVILLSPYSAVLADDMMAMIRELTIGSAPSGFGRGLLVSLANIASLSPTIALAESSTGVELWQWILLGVGGLLLLLCCIGWGLRKRKKRKEELEMQYLRKLQKEREGHQFTIEGDDIYHEGEEPWA